MQLPRGKFRSVIKGVALDSLIQELAEVRYTGNITITWRHEAISLVIQKGRYILAEYGSLKGDAAWEGMITLGETTIDAILSDFTDPEMKLAIEFNEAYVLSTRAVPRPPKASGERPARGPVSPPERTREVVRERPPEAAREKPPEIPRLSGGSREYPPENRSLSEGPRENPLENQGLSEGPRESPPGNPAVSIPIIPMDPPAPLPPFPAPGAVEEEPSPSPVLEEPAISPKGWTSVDMSQAIAVTTDQGASEMPPGGYDELALLHMEMSALDDVDVEHIATKIRKNARGIVKKLHLGHLMTEKEE
ncbi:MAG TPA: hypothetical protein VMB35_08690 [Methanomicrobiales archaeon]|nr:hypothetical protein [Methanomicrobiales archaeon]